MRMMREAGVVLKMYTGVAGCHEWRNLRNSRNPRDLLMDKFSSLVNDQI